MAGGRGSRLKPLTNILPKPLIPLGKKTIIEEIWIGL
ncbi:MAG: sugar phosphate nucleotidyltransferase [Bacteroidales bacterium]